MLKQDRWHKVRRDDRLGCSDLILTYTHEGDGAISIRYLQDVRCRRVRD